MLPTPAGAVITTTPLPKLVAVGCVARPVGAAAFGHFGDRKGRKSALVMALLLMGSASILIGCPPSYASAGALAPVLLVALRFVQGLAILITFVIYVAAVCADFFLSVTLLRETRHVDLNRAAVES